MDQHAATRRPLISVIMPVYDGARFVAQAVESVLEQTLGDLELLVVDDGSTDGTPDLVRSFGDPRVKLLVNEHRGEGAARNRGLEAAAGTLVAWQDSDDVALPGRLERLHTAISLGADFAHSDMLLIDERDRPVGFMRSSQMPRERVLGMLLRQGTPYNNPTMMLRASSIGRLRFDESLRIGVDTDFVRRYAPYHDGVHVPEPLVAYRRHETQLTKEVTPEDLLPEMLRLLSDEPLTALVPEAFRHYATGDVAVARGFVALTLARRGQFDLAEQWFRAALAEPADQDARGVVNGCTRVAVGDAQGALAVLGGLRRTPLTLVLQGQVLAQLGRGEDAADCWYRALADDPDCYDAVLGMRALGESAGLVVVDDPRRLVLGVSSR